MAGMFEGNIDQTVDLIAKGIEQTLAEEIERKFKKQIESLIKELAVDYAKMVTAKVHAMKKYDSGVTQLIVMFNDKNIHEEENA